MKYESVKNTNQKVFDGISTNEVVHNICDKFLKDKSAYFEFNINGKNFAILKDGKVYVLKRYRVCEYKLWYQYGHKDSLLGNFQTNYAITNFTKTFCRQAISRFRHFIHRGLFFGGRFEKPTNEKPHNERCLIFKNIDVKKGGK